MFENEDTSSDERSRDLIDSVNCLRKSDMIVFYLGWKRRKRTKEDPKMQADKKRRQSFRLSVLCPVSWKFFDGFDDVRPGTAQSRRK